MNREEKIEILNLIINNIDGSFFEWIVEKKYLEAKNIDTENIINLDEMFDDLCWMFHEVVDKSMELYKQLLQLPTRTLETLEVGDVIITKLKGNEWTQISMQEQSQINHFIAFSHCYDIDTVIPHEFLEIWGEINA